MPIREVEWSLPRRVSTYASLWVPLRARLGVVCVLGAAGAAWVGYLTSENPDAAPPGVAVGFRVATISVLILTGVWAQTSGSQARVGRLLVLAGLFACLWLLQGSRNPLLFEVGVLSTGFITLMFSYLMLAHPTGRLRSRMERRMIGIPGAVGVACWLMAVLTTTEPPVSTPLLRCTPHCPRNPLFLGFTTGATPTLRVLVSLSWVIVVGGVVLLLARRMRSASPPGRRMIAPVLLVALYYLLSVGGFLVVKSAAPHLSSAFGTATVSMAILMPLGVAAGLISERLFMGQALQGFINDLSNAVPLDLERRMSEYLRDSSLKIAYRRPILNTYVDADGAAVAIPASNDTSRATTVIQRGDHPVAMVIYDREMSDQGRYVKAAGSAAMIWLENAQLQADLRASVTDLADSRSRLVEAADEERRRIERDLHDGVQQDLVGTQLRLQTAADAIKTNPERAERILGMISDQVDHALEDLRSLARGIYPALLEEHGVADALRSVAQRSPTPVSIQAHGIGRYRPELEAAVYFCSLEAIQNATKHAGADAAVVVHLWERNDRLCFEVTDTGEGFRPSAAAPGVGLTSMRDRLAAVGGILSITSHRSHGITSRPDHGTTIRGTAPINPRRQPDTDPLVFDFDRPPAGSAG